MTSQRRPRVVIFVGPSLAAADVRAQLQDVDADLLLLPPVEQGDILRLGPQFPDVIGIIDGAFFHAPTVLHREILLALQRGARVLGAASLGSLRAAELDSFGMEGIGEIYRLFRTGRIDGDDEVAVLHAPASDGYHPLTEALVSIRHNLDRARERSILSARSVVGMVRALKRLHFSQRTTAAVLAAAPADERPALAHFLCDEAVDLKRQDALLLVRTIADRIAGPVAQPPRAPVQVNQTVHFWRYRRAYEGVQRGDLWIPDDLTLGFQRLLSPTFQAIQREVTRRCLALDEADHRALASDDSAALLERFCAARDLRSEATLQTWLREHALSHDELVALLRERDLEARVLAVYRGQAPSGTTLASLHRLIRRDVALRHGIPEHSLKRPPLVYPGVPWSDALIRELKLGDAFAPAVELACQILHHNANISRRHPQLAQAPVRQGVLVDYFAERWRIDSGHFGAAIRARGFVDYDDAVEAARHVFLYERTSSDTYHVERLIDCFHINAVEQET